MNENNFKMNQSSENPILKLTFAFAIEAVKYSEVLETNKKYVKAILKVSNIHRSLCSGSPKCRK